MPIADRQDSQSAARTVEAPSELSRPSIKLFISYAHRDEDLRLELDDHLSNLQRQQIISGWHDRRIAPGQEWADQIDNALNEAQIILLLISARFMASDYCYAKEMVRAIERHDAGEAVVIPIILSACDWQGAPFSKLQPLPKDARPIKNWNDRDEAWLDVVRGLRRVIESLSRPVPTLETTVTEKLKRRLDAAISSRALVGQSIDLLVQVRFPDSPLLGLDEWPTKNKPTSVEQVSENTDLEFPRDINTGKTGNARLVVKVHAPDFDVEGTSDKLLEVPPDQFSKKLSFLLTAKRPGFCRINVEVYDLNQLYLGVAAVELEVGKETGSHSVSQKYNVANLYIVVAIRPKVTPTLVIPSPNSRIPSKPTATTRQGNVAIGGHVSDSIIITGSGNTVIRGAPSAELDFKSKQRIVDALLDCECLKTPHSIDQLVAELPADIRSRIKRHSNPKQDVLSIVNTCLEFEAGLKDFLEIVENFEGKSRRWLDLQAVLREVAPDLSSD